MQTTFANTSVARMVLKGCPRCHGDLVIDPDLVAMRDVALYECLQCGRSIRIALEPEEAPVQKLAA